MRITIPALLAFLATTQCLPALAQRLGEDAQAQADRALRSIYDPEGLTVEEAVTRIIETSPDLESARAAVLAARGAKKQATAAMVPQLDMTARYIHLSPVQNRGLTTGTQDQIDMLIDQVTDPAAQALFRGITDFSFPVILDRFAFDADLIYPLTSAFVEVLPTLKATKFEKKAAKAQVQNERALLELLGRQVFYDYARATAAQAVAVVVLEESQAQQTRMASLVRAGTAAAVDLLRVDAQVASSEVFLARAERDLAVSKRQLQALLHSDEPVSLGEDLSAPVTDLPKGAVAELQAQAFAERPDMLAIKEFIKARDKSVRAARGGMYPEVILQGNARYANPNIRVIPQTKDFKGTWEVGAALRWSPNETADGRGRTDQAAADLRQARADLIALQDRIKVEVAEGYHSLKAAQTALKSAVVGLAAARESYRVIKLQLDAGIVNTTDLLVAQADINRARLELVASAVGLRVARATLKRAIGEVPP